MLYPLSELKGLKIDARDEPIGKIKDVLFDDESWTIRYLVADTGGWLTGRKVLLAPDAVTVGVWPEGKLPVRLTRKQVEDSPGIEEDAPVSQQHQRDLHSYYGWPVYWGAAPYPMSGVLPPAVPVTTAGDAIAPAAVPAGDPNLRSGGEVTGCTIQATDGDLGHVGDFLVDTRDWVIRFVIVDTRNWLPGRKVLLRPRHVDRVSWSRGEVTVKLDRKSIEERPEFDPDSPPEAAAGDLFLTGRDPARR
ncbi:PRC-barrel domain-containing protein [Opitutales bacterium ASA1]|uniref:PRC-barrel domain-containing protein n=1 Tax=Congregicoccus parvus TaxID=3081749 RepID=UPI002B2DAFFB|nr:PRC-barrel domain-containing protein [Opitutales bacterium ASA1]